LANVKDQPAKKRTSGLYALRTIHALWSTPRTYTAQQTTRKATLNEA